MRINNIELSEFSVAFLIMIGVVTGGLIMYGIASVIPHLSIVLFYIYLLIVYSFRFTKGWKEKGKWQKFYSSFFIGILLINLVLQVSNNWQYSLWGRESAFKTVDSFLNTMKSGDYKSITQNLGFCLEHRVDINSLDYQQRTKPTQWQLTEYHDYANATIIGYATLADKSEVSIKFELKWNRLKWEVVSVEFGEVGNVGHIDNMRLWYSINC